MKITKRKTNGSYSDHQIKRSIEKYKEKKS